MSSQTGSSERQLSHLYALAREALDAWRLSAGELTLIKFRENAVFRVLMPSGVRYALRIHRPGYHSGQALRSELFWIDTLAKAGIEVPQPIPSSDGHLLVSVIRDGECRYADLFVWIEGRQLGDVESISGADPGSIHSIYATIGQVAARLHNHSSQWIVPENFERHAWDLDGLIGEAPFWGRFWELAALTEAQRDLILQAREAIRADLLAYGQGQLRYSMIHADFVPENLLVDGNKVRLIDFDDAGFGWHMFEIATALYFIQNESFYNDAKTALLEGYHQCRPLAQRDLDTLPLFLAARGFTYLGWVQDRGETETAREFTPRLIEMACETAARYLKRAPVVK